MLLFDPSVMLAIAKGLEVIFEVAPLVDHPVHLYTA